MTEWTFKGAAKRLEDIDLPRIGRTIGVGEDELHALMDVEAAGSGFDSKGRPKMLFEPHIFWKLLGPGKARNEAVKQGLAYAKWKKGGYPSDSYPRLRKAMEINSTVALMSASWGLFQIMGFNHGAAGYATPEEMVRDFMADEDNHLEAVVRFLLNKKLDDDLREHRWGVIEQKYNGGGFGGSYATKLEKAFAKWQKIKDTAYSPEQASPAPQIVQDEVSASPAPDTPENPPSPIPAPPSTPAMPTPGQVAGTTAVLAGGSTFMGVPWWVAAAVGIAVFMVIVAVVIAHKKKSAA